MVDLETRLISGYQKEPFLWLRFIDDILALWTHGLECMNKFHESIKFTMEFSLEKIVFLDTLVKISEDKQYLLINYILVLNKLTPITIYISTRLILPTRKGRTLWTIS